MAWADWLNGMRRRFLSDPVRGTALSRTRRARVLRGESTEIARMVERLEDRSLMTATPQVIDLSPGYGDSNPKNLMQVDGALFFTTSSYSGSGLWKSDGTAAGTVKLLATVGDSRRDVDRAIDLRERRIVTDSCQKLHRSRRCAIRFPKPRP